MLLNSSTIHDVLLHFELCIKSKLLPFKANKGEEMETWKFITPGMNLPEKGSAKLMLLGKSCISSAESQKVFHKSEHDWTTSDRSTVTHLRWSSFAHRCVFPVRDKFTASDKLARKTRLCCHSLLKVVNIISKLCVDDRLHSLSV